MPALSGSWSWTTVPSSVFVYDANSLTPIERTTYRYDSNDRLLEEILDRTPQNDDAPVETKIYGYDETQLTSIVSKNADDVITSTTTNGYNLQGRQNSIQINGGGLTTLNFTYDSRGTRVSKSAVVENADGQSTNTYTTFLVDYLNPTGYSQILEERTYDRQQSSTLHGIAYGISGGDLKFSSDGDEFAIDGSQFSHDRNVYELTGDFRRINASNARTGTAYLMYFGKHNDSRFNNQEPAAPSNLALVVYEDGKWKYDSQIAPLTEFTPQLSLSSLRRLISMVTIRRFRPQKRRSSSYQSMI